MAGRKRRRRIFGTGVLCQCLLGAGLGTAMWAGEPVRFSDTAVAPSDAAAGRMRLQPSNLDRGFPRSSSLQGVTAPPFAPPRSTTGPRLSPEDFERMDQRRNWLFHGGDQLSFSDETVHRVLGVRPIDQALDPEAAFADEPSRTALERYVLDGAAAEPAGLREDPTAFRSLTSPYEEQDSRRPLFGGPESLRLTESDTGREPSSLDSYYLNQLVNGDASAREGTAGDAERSRPGPSWTGTLNRPVGDIPAERQGISRLFEVPPISRSIGPRLSEVMDPINFYPDETRQELNPVTASTETMRSSTDPLFFDRRDPEAAPSLTRTRTLDDLAETARGSLGPLMGSAETTDRRNSALKSVPVRLEIPTRSF